MEFRVGCFELRGLLREFLEQPHVLDGDHRLICERLEQGNLFLGKRADLGATES